MVFSVVVDEGDGPLYVCKGVGSYTVAPATSALLLCHKTMCLVPVDEGSQSVLADAVKTRLSFY